MISRSAAGKSCSSTLTIACSMKRSWLYVSISTLTKLLGKFALPKILNPASSEDHFNSWQPVFLPFPPPLSSLRKNRTAACASSERHPAHTDDDSPGTAPRVHADNCKPGAAAS